MSHPFQSTVSAAACMLSQDSRRFTARPIAPLQPLRPELSGGDAQTQPQLSVVWARHLSEVHEAQRLRYQVFGVEMGAQLDTPIPGHDHDEFDACCEHLLVRDELTQAVVGTYRLLTPAQAKRVGRWYTDTEFDLSACKLDRANTVELGRSCIHEDYRQGPVLMMLWGALVKFLAQQGVQSLVGCASIPLNVHGLASPVGLAMASNIYSQLDMYLVAPAERAVPHMPLPLQDSANDLPAQPPALIRGYLRLGARLLGAPCWDAAFNTADLAVRLRVQDLPLRFRKEFLAHA